MGAADIVGFAVCWMFAAVVLTWGVVSERHRGAPRPRSGSPDGSDGTRATRGLRGFRRLGSRPGGGRRVLGPRTRSWRRQVVAATPSQPPPEPLPAMPRPLGRPLGPGWVVVERLTGSGDQVRAEGELLVAAALAARGLEVAQLAPGDLRTETIPLGAGKEATVFLLRAGVLSHARPS